MKFKRTGNDAPINNHDLETLNQLCNGKTGEELEVMAQVVRDWRLKSRGEKEILARAQHRPGDKVSFRTKGGALVTGIVKTANQRTLSLHQCSDGGRWKVAYCFVTKVE